MTSPAQVPLPLSPTPFSPPSPFTTTTGYGTPSPTLAFSRRPSLSITQSDAHSRRSSASQTPSHSFQQLSRSTLRPRLDRSFTAIRRETVDPFHEGATIEVNQPVGSLSISPSNRDVCLASRKGLYIIDLANLNNAPRFVPQGGTWQIADVQWSPHPATSNLILSTSSQKLLVWDLAAQVHLHRSIDAHARAITDINWHARDPNIMATVAMDAGIRGWDLRCLDRPVMRLCAWGQAGTQVKWNRQHDHLLATAHGKEVLVWDNRKGSVPVVSIRAHDAKIYGLDWDRQWRHKLVTCSLDKTVKYWTVPELRASAGATEDAFYPGLPVPSEATSTIRTSYPVWRARNLPFGHGVLTLPQRGSDNLEMFALGDDAPVQTFEGHSDVVKDFVWRSRGGEDANFENREFQLITWSKDHTLRVWPVQREVAEKVGYQYGAPIQVLVSRRGAKDITYTTVHDAEQRKALPLPIVNPPSGITKAKSAKQAEVGMTRGGGKAVGMDQLDWLTKVVKNKASPDSSVQPSRMGSVSRAASRSLSRDRKQSERGVSVGFGEREGWISLKDEIVLVNRLFPRPRINFEKIDLHHRKLTMSMLGPWANGERMAFIRIHWHFPAQYPYAVEIPTFELERNPTVSPIVRQDIIMTIKSIRAENRQCLAATSSYLVGEHQRLGRTRINLDSDSDTDADGDIGVSNNVVMLTRTSGATFGPNGELVCFFPKQTMLPRIRAMSRSPSVSRSNNPLLKAMSALAIMSNPNSRSMQPRTRVRRTRVEIATQAVSAGSTLTIHSAAVFGNPSKDLARKYGIPADVGELDRMIGVAADAKRLDHVLVLETLRGVLEDPPPPYSLHAAYGGERDARLDRERWERGVAARLEILDQIFETLIAFKDFQMLALVSILVYRHVQTEVVPSVPHRLIAHSPEQDYFGLPRTQSYHTLSRSRASPSYRGSAAGIQPLHSLIHRNSSHSVYGSSLVADRATGSSAGLSGWSSILHPSTVSLRGSDAVTPKDRSSFDLPHSKTPYGFSLGEDGSPTPGIAPHSAFGRVKSSPRIPEYEPAGDKKDSRRHRDSDSGFVDRSSRRPTHLSMGTYSSGGTATPGPAGPPSSNTTPTPGDHRGSAFGYPPPLKSADTERSMGSVGSTPGTGGAVSGFGRHHSAGFIDGTGSGSRAGSSGWAGAGYRSSSMRGGSDRAGSPAPAGSGGRRNTAGGRRGMTAGTGGRGDERGAGKEGRSRRTCGVRIELVLDDHDTPALLSQGRMQQCEAWKLAYADFLLRAELYGLRAELMGVRFLPEGDELQARVEVKGDEMPEGLGIACVGCGPGIGQTCSACGEKAIRALCSYCRLPIKGLSTTCSICCHKTHLSCARKRPSSSSSTCPACPCRCMSQGGLTSASLAYATHAPAASTAPTPLVSYATAASVTVPPTRGQSTTTARGWKVLDMLREGDRSMANPSPTPSAHGQSQASMAGASPAEQLLSSAAAGHGSGHRPSFGAFASSGTGPGSSGISALGLGFGDVASGSRGGQEGDQGGGAERDGASTAAGILARARAVMDGGAGWRSNAL